MNPVNGFHTGRLADTRAESTCQFRSTHSGLDDQAAGRSIFGELDEYRVYVKTRQKEFNYPQGDNDNLTSYEGSGGIRLGGFLRRTLMP